MKPISGTFLDEITWDIPAQNWGRAEWRREFDTFKQAGIDTVIIIRSTLRDMCVFPSETLGVRDVPDLAQLFLDEAHRTGIKLYFGTHDSGTLDWHMTNWKHDWELAQKFLPEILRRYGQHPAFHGWYIAPETCVATTGSVEIYSRYSKYMKELTPEKPVLISPYFPSDVYKAFTPADRQARFAEDWRRILKAVDGHIDFCAFQDGSCSFQQTENPVLELELYTKTVHEFLKEAKVVQWNNVECFARNMPWRFPPLDWRWMKRKMEITDPYCVKHITFTFSNYMSPNSMWESARCLYQRYREEILGEGSPETRLPR